MQLIIALQINPITNLKSTTMKKCSLFALILTVLFFKSEAQNTFAPIGAEWWYDADSYDYTPIILPGITQQYYWTDHAKVTGDTVINGTTCNKIEVSRMQSQSPKPDSIYLAQQKTYYVYDNTDTVFIYSGYASQFRPLFIFNLQEHDTVCMQNPYPYGAGDDTTFCFIVDSIRNPLIGNIPLKTIFTRPMNMSANGYEWLNWGSDLLIRNTLIGAYSQRIGINIGLSGGILPVYINPLADGAAFVSFPFGKLRCYNDSAITIHYGSLPCDTILPAPPLAIKDIQQSNFNISIYPNPTKNHINISFKTILNNDLNVNITDVIGRKLSSFKIPQKTSSISIDVSKYPSGIYLMAFQNGTDRFYYKMVVQQ